MAVRRSAKKPQKKESGLGFIIGLAVLLFLVGVLLFNRDRIARIAEAARSAEGAAKPVAAVPPEQPPAAAPSAQPAAPEQKQPDKTAPAPTAPPAQPAPETTPPAAKPTEQKPVAAPPAATPQKPATQTPAPVKPAPASPTVPTAAPPTKKPPEKPAVQARERTLWFVKVGDDGVIERVKEVRALPVSDSPLADAIGALMTGPSEAARKKGWSSLIPQGTKLLSATVRGATAYLSFSDQFQFNPYGIEGFAAQLRQIVWTATEFDTVKDVQILIEGRRVDYLGLEGIWIGSPIGRAAL